MKFILEIELGNDAMRTYNDVGDALQRVAAVMFRHDMDTPVRSANPISDANGNTVGKWEVADDRLSPARTTHAFSPSDIHPDTCGICGKYERYTIHA